MRTRLLGSTGIKVPGIALGTVELGLDYGFKGSGHFRKPDREDAVRLVLHALDAGVTLIDTARAYGSAEEVIGEALRRTDLRPVIATKLAIDGSTRREQVIESVETSLRTLGVEAVDILQIHNARSEALANGEAMEALEGVVSSGKARFAGASIYAEEEALAAIRRTGLRTLQVPFNLLDQTMADRAFPSAAEQGTGVLVRSAFLRGVLTPQVHELPPRLAPLRDAALTAMRLTGVDDLAVLALRFCLSFDAVSSVIVGVRTVEELDANLGALRQGPLPAGLLELREEFRVRDEIRSPANWAGLI
ncbi:MAG: aldo/keto reductase [Acidobacteria bacterium]|nr:aldo/keto reductase [Acidobacteriota bacterium]